VEWARMVLIDLPVQIARIELAKEPKTVGGG